MDDEETDPYHLLQMKRARPPHSRLDPEGVSRAYDEAVLQTRGISPYCSCSDWGLAALAHLHPNRTPIIVRRGESWVALTLGSHEDVGVYLQPLEADWGFASPLIGPDTRRSVELLEEVLDQTESWRVALLTGLPLEIATRTALSLDARYRVVVRDGIRCQVATLAGGLDGFLARRSAKFRRNLLRDRRRARRAGIELETIREIPEIDGEIEAKTPIMQRILAVEQRSWKFATGESVLHAPRYYAFYSEMLTRAARRGRLRVVFARLDDRDVAYCFGGVHGTSYRGFQLAYSDDVAHLGLGNLAQLEMIEHLTSEGVDSYDLGMEMAYKERWADETLSLYTVVIVRRA